MSVQLGRHHHFGACVAFKSLSLSPIRPFHPLLPSAPRPGGRISTNDRLGTPRNSSSVKPRQVARYRLDSDVDIKTQQPLRFPEADIAVFSRAAAAWQRLCTQAVPPPPAVARQHTGPAPVGVASASYDVVVLGGTLGVLLATALLARHSSGAAADKQPLRVAVVERGVLAGREQEWNCTQADLQVLVDLGVLTDSEAAEVVVTHVPAVRVGVAGIAELQLTGVMDAGVSPHVLLDIVKRRFLELGGQLLEGTAFDRLSVYDDCAHLHLKRQQQQQQRTAPAAEAAGGAGGRQAVFDPAAASTAAPECSSPVVLSATVVVDALGSFSPLSAQARGAVKPEAAMLLVGSCVDMPAQGAAGTAEVADVLWGMEPIDKASCQQYWWERFPAAGGRALTSYMFTFTDPAPDNQQLLDNMMDTYCDTLGTYLGVSPGSLSVRRSVCGYVPCYSQRVVPVVDRVLPVGDSAANRSALSLAGFCALLRHMGRLTEGLLEALAVGATTQQELSLLQPWCPGVTATTAMQRTMSVYSSQFPTVRAAAAAATASQQQQQPGDVLSSVLSIMGASLAAMWDAVGEEGMRPFVADRIQFAPLAASMAAQLSKDAPQLLAYSAFLGDAQGASRLLLGMAGLASYQLMHSMTPLTSPLHEALLGASPRLLYRWHRATDAWRYGSGSDWLTAPSHHHQQQQQQTHEAGQGTQSPPTSAVHTTSRGPQRLAAAAGGRVGAGALQLAWGGSLWRFSPSSRSLSSSAGFAAAPHRPRCVAAAATGRGSRGSAGSDSLSWKPEDVEVLLNGKLDRCDLIDAFSHAAIQQQGRPREDVYSYMEPPAPAGSSNKGSTAAGLAAARPTFPAWCELMQSMDSHEVIDWSDLENDGWGEPANSSDDSSSSSSSFADRDGASSSSSSSSTLPPTAAAAATSRRHCFGPCSSSAASSVGLAWGSSMARVAGVQPGVWTAAAGLQRRRAVAMCAAPSGKTDAEADDAPCYEGADSDTLFPPGSPEMDDPGHPTELAGLGSKDTQAAVTRPQAKPYMNIKDGKWVPPSKAEAQKMLQQLSQMGPDEGI